MSMRSRNFQRFTDQLPTAIDRWYSMKHTSTSLNEKNNMAPNNSVQPTNLGNATELLKIVDV